ncbi:MAG TPA: chemotaxis protein CheW [Gemmatimonadaceae bacterium]
MSEPRDAERDRALLEERARLLARASAAPAPEGAWVRALVFLLGQETYAVETRWVFAVFRLAGITPLPGAEPPVYGLTTWRGEVLTVLDLRRTLGASWTALDDLSRVIVLGDQRPAFGILADEAREIRALPMADILPLPEARARPHLAGITRDAVLVLDVPPLLRQQTGAP